jgi:alpha-D-ribose 1-methylphosphonate 5-phosphate C-P lyase
MSVWGSNASYASRANQLAQGVGPGRIVRVVASNIGDDSAVDTLQGGDDDDWFVADVLDLLADRLTRERLLRK